MQKASEPNIISIQDTLLKILFFLRASVHGCRSIKVDEVNIQGSSTWHNSSFKIRTSSVSVQHSSDMSSLILYMSTAYVLTLPSYISSNLNKIPRFLTTETPNIGFPTHHLSLMRLRWVRVGNITVLSRALQRTFPVRKLHLRS